MQEPTTHYVITWRDPRDGEIVTLKAKTIRDSTLGLIFIAISDFIWESSSLIVNPGFEALARRFEHTKTLHLSIHSILSIEEVGPEHKGLTFDKDRSKVVLFPPTPDKR